MLRVCLASLLGVEHGLQAAALNQFCSKDPLELEANIAWQLCGTMYIMPL